MKIKSLPLEGKVIRPHIIQIEFFRFEELHVEINTKISEEDLKNPPADHHQFSFRLATNKDEPLKPRLYVRLKTNDLDDEFQSRLFRIDLTAFLQLVFPENTQKETIFNNIELSGLHLLWTSLRAQLMTLTSMMAAPREYILPVLDLSDAQKEFGEKIKKQFNK